MRRSIARNRRITIVRSKPRSVGSRVLRVPRMDPVPPADDAKRADSTVASVPAKNISAATSRSRTPENSI